MAKKKKKKKNINHYNTNKRKNVKYNKKNNLNKTKKKKSNSTKNKVKNIPKNSNQEIKNINKENTDNKIIYVKKRSLKLKKNISDLLAILFLFIFICIFCFSLSKIIIWNFDNKNYDVIKKQILDDINIVEINSTSSTTNTVLFNEPESEIDIYWKYKDVPLIDVDLTKLKQENNDTIGWIQVLGTNINYPIVQSNDNDYYLKHDFLKKYNGGGWIYMDYRNNINALTNNNVIYGHRRYNTSMFGSLKNVLTNDWLNNTNNHIIKISTEQYNYLFQVFSVYSIPNESYYIQTDFETEEKYTEFLNTIISRSVHNFNTEVNLNTKILTLSTCHNDNDRLAVHAKLIKINQKISE